MGTPIPEEVRNFPISQLLESHGCKLFKDPGKVSEMRILPGQPDLLMILTLPRKSIFDFSLNGIFNKTDEVITAMTVLIEGIVLEKLGIPTHLVAYGKGIDKYLPQALRGNTKLQKTALIVRRFEIGEVDKWEWIWRYNHTGSAVSSFNKTGTVYGHKVRADIKEGEAYDEPLDTPTTKEESGHDQPLTRQEIVGKHQEHIVFTRRIAMAIHDYFKERGIILADLKLECSIIIAGIIYMLDKFGPDEARFWDAMEALDAIAHGRVPKSMDKEILRLWGKGILTPFPGEDSKPIVGINKLDPENEDHIAFVHSQKVPKDVIDNTVTAYLNIFQRANDGKSLEEFQRDVMGIEETNISRHITF